MTAKYGELQSFIAANDWQGVIGVCEQESSKEEFDPFYVYARAFAAFVEDDIAQAYLLGEEALRLLPNAAQVADFMSVVAVYAGKSKDSYYFSKVKGTLQDDPDIAAVFPSDLIPKYGEVLSTVVDKPLLLRGVKAYRDNELDKAENWFRQHIILNPEDLQGHQALIECLVLEERYRGAIEALRSALHIIPNNAELLSREAVLLTQLGMFQDAAACHRYAQRLAPNDAVIAANYCLDVLEDPECSIETIVGLHQAWWDKFAFKPKGNAPKADPDKKVLTVTCVVVGIETMRFGATLALALAHRDPGRYNFVGLGHGEIEEPRNSLYKKAFDDWRSISIDDPYTLQEIIQAFDTDILINCVGLKQPEMLRVMGARLAPVQMLYAPAVLAGEPQGIDAQITGSALVAREKKYVFDVGYAVSNIEQGDEKGVLGVERSSGSVFTFGADASFAELNGRTVETWVRILNEVPNSMLLLRNHDFERPENSTLLMEKFGNFGMAHRVDIMASATFREFAREIDVLLMPARTQRYYLAAEALNAGVPVVVNEQWDAVVGAVTDICKNNNAAENMLAQDEDQYVAHSVYWAGEEAKRAELRNTLPLNLNNGNYCNNRQRMEELSDVLERYWAEAVKRA
ncbi:hypothetical protein [Terasakiella pusilla]|uniref:hypothetical protein n=1 Tax=Terasakiella pusilla TaxID=64973 RepID=UPI00048BF32C|nr:hypothetical protein [Terasakiella pusilla]